MQLAVLSCYENLINGIAIGSANLTQLQSQAGWGQGHLTTLSEKLGAIRAAEAALYTAAHALSARVWEGQSALAGLKSALLLTHDPRIPDLLPASESSFRYSTSLSSFSALTWQYTVMDVWVTANSAYKVPATCPSAMAIEGETAPRTEGHGPGKFAPTKTSPAK